MSQLKSKLYPSIMEIKKMLRHSNDNERKHIYIDAGCYAGDDIDFTDLIAQLRHGYEEMGSINLALAQEAFAAENEVAGIYKKSASEVHRP